jgi:hypothetical protein
MTKETTPSEPKERDWLDILTKLATPLVVGLSVAGIGLYGDYALNAIAERDEHARLITELQVKREQAETDLRKDVFQQTVVTLLKTPESHVGIQELSKRMLHLELLAVNFGDSLSLSPLFNEFKRDLDDAAATSTKEVNKAENLGSLNRRLTSLAKRVASTQVSSLIQHGPYVNIRIPLPGLKPDTPSCTLLYDYEFKWPVDEIKLALTGHTNGNDDPEEIMAEFPDKGIINIVNRRRRLELFITNINHCTKSARVNMAIWPVNEKGKPYVRPSESLEVEREFRLDFFNFPMVDNTRLADNQRFSLLMEDFAINDFSSSLELVAMAFPAEYASMRDRLGMKEASALLKSVLDEQSEND